MVVLRMTKKLPWLLVFMFGTVTASEFRSPSVAEKGPLRYVFDADKPGSDSSLTMWTAYTSKSANKAFINHGTSVSELTKLFFNESEFRLARAFPNCLVEQAGELYSPLLRTTKFKTRAKYTECSCIMGARWSCPVFEDKGRFVIRATVPLRRVEIERTDQSGVRGGAELQDVLTVQPVAKPSTDTGVTAKQSVAIRADFAEALQQSNHKNPALDFTGKIKVGGHEICTFGSEDTADQNQTDATKCLAVVGVDEGLIPHVPSVTSNVAVVSDKKASGSSYSAVPAAGGGGSGLSYFSDTSGTYANLAEDASKTVADRKTDQDTKARMWLIPFRGNDATQIEGVDTGGTMDNLRILSEQVTENPREWLADRGYKFETTSDVGLGDIDIDVGYEHLLNEKMKAEGYIGVRAPTGRGDEYWSNPYQVRRGNGQHWEARFGGTFAWQPFTWLTAKGDMYYSFALEHTEKRCAAFTGADIKNMGPQVDANVDWQYLVVRLDCNLFHPETQSLSSVFGYELLWKRKDNITFSVANMQTWLGKKYNSTTNAFATDEYALDADVAEKYTNSVGHKVRFETSLRATDYCEMFIGGSYTFAGKNLPREQDIHAGINLTY
ncbi:hypothetical protein HOD08_04340 [bacterium]|nr:hypothetical protein [bacterium]